MRCRCRLPADGVIDVRAERLAAGVAIEERRKHARRKSGGNEERGSAESVQNKFAELARGGMSLRAAASYLWRARIGARRLRGHLPSGRDRVSLAGLHDLRGGEYIGYGEKHSQSLELEFEATDQSGASGTQHDMPGMQLIVVVAICQVIDIGCSVDVFVERMARAWR